jgi:Flp pilus assembly protein TadG
MSNRIPSARHRERGFILILYALMMLFIIMPIVGLAIDAGILYMIKGKLQLAVDGAALGAARNLSANVSIDSQESTAGAAGIANFHANFPNNWMGVTPVNDPTVDWSQSTTSTAVVNITGTVTSPTWFMRILGFNSVTVTATGEATRRNLNVLLVIDRSYSLSAEGNCPTLQADAESFVNNSFVEGRDQVGMVTFGTSYNYDFAFNSTFKSSLTTQLTNLHCTGYTNAAAAFSYGYKKLAALTTAPGSLNVIVFFTDGEPNTMTFGVNTTTNAADTTSTYNPLSVLTSSSCNPHASGTKTSGVIAGDVSFNSWAGLMNWTNGGIPLSDSDFDAALGSGPSPPISETGCSFQTGGSSPTYNAQGSGNSPSFSNDIASLPPADAFGNATNATWSGGSNGSFPYTVALTGSSWYTQQNLENAGINTLDNAAQNARAAAATANIPYVVYTIGLNPTASYGSVNQELLRRVANDPGSAVYQTSYTPGKFYYVPSAGELSQAFAAIASDILRIAK